MLQIKGVGQTKFMKYGQSFMDKISQFVQENKIEPSSIIPVPVHHEKQPIQKEQLEQPSHVLSYDWYTQGMAIDEIARKRQLTKITIQKHILRSVREGHKLNWSEIFDTETEKRVLEAIQETGGEKLKPIWEALNGEIDYFTIQAVMCKNELG